MGCPCGSGKNYKDCCKLYHDGAIPPTALDLMRSRYSAYAMKNASYIMDTTHEDSPYFETDRKKWKAAILQFCNSTQFIRLEIFSSGEDWVHFAAHLKQKKELVLEENSSFQKAHGKWLYLKGDFKKL